MRITASQIEDWASTREAQGNLPKLVRRLILQTAKLTELSMPGGDSIYTPGWDGITNALQGCPWVPVGAARWEISCDAKPREKAESDFRKRVAETPNAELADLVFVFVTARRWSKKKQWQQDAAVRAPWRDVRALDADDLEAWLELAPEVMLQFAELMGLSGFGIETPDRFWERWRGQTRYPLTAEALLADRDSAAQRFDKLISDLAPIISVEADSQEEAVAFACVRIAAIRPSNSSACITALEGWRFVDGNTALRVVIACSTEVASSRSPRDRISLVIPIRRGERRDVLGTAPRIDSPIVSLARPSFTSFEQQLIQLGEEESTAARLARSVGRSWSVYRRLQATNPAIRRPSWLIPSNIRALTTLALVGAWNSSKSGDRACVEAIDGRPYEDLERELRSLSDNDDSPVIQIGTIWQARSPLELLELLVSCVSALSPDVLDRFFSVAEATLARPDPSLELEEEKRWMAAVYGKTREESGIVIHAIADSLVKLSVHAERRGDDVIIGRANALVRKLLHGASGEQWLSASGILRELAEAAPTEFLSALNQSLRNPARNVTRLISESSGDGIGGGCWYANLLWALETLAWPSDRLLEVAEALIRLCAVPVPGNRSNTPARSLQSLFRAWWPQTMAPSETRLAVLDILISNHNESAWPLLISLLPRESHSASPNAAPVWRDDDVGKNDLWGQLDLWYLSEVGARIISQAAERPERIAKLLASLDSFDGSYGDSVVKLVETATKFDDNGRAAIRDGLRKYLAWHNLHNQSGKRRSRTFADRLRPMFDRLEPADPVKANLWLFASNWVQLPGGTDKDHESLEKERTRAFESVFASLGWSGISRLATEAAEPLLVGWEIGNSALDLAEIVAWAIERRRTEGGARLDLVLRGLLTAMDVEKRTATLGLAIAQLHGQECDSEIPGILINAPFSPDVWKLLESINSELRDRYWASVVPSVNKLEIGDMKTAAEQLTKHGRARSTFKLLMGKPESADPRVLKSLLVAIQRGAELDGPLPDAWCIGEAVSAIESSDEISKRELAMLEFAYFHALGETEHKPKNLYSELLSDPSFFMELICLVYKPRNREPEFFDETMRAVVNIAYDVLAIHRDIPVMRPEGRIEDSELKQWVDQVRRLAAENDRVEDTDRVIGRWLANLNPDTGTSWPAFAIAEILDVEEHEDIRRGFHIGIIDQRGVTVRALREGGAQERVLATRFKERATAFANQLPRVSARLNLIAEHYMQEARRRDHDARLREER